MRSSVMVGNGNECEVARYFGVHHKADKLVCQCTTPAAASRIE